MTDIKPAQLIKKILDLDGLPVLSPLAVQLVKMAADDDTSVQDLADIIKKDPSLTTRLLKLAGSAFFGRAGRVGSINQAIMILGFKRVRLMALSLSLLDTFPLSRSEGLNYDHFWKTSLYRAMLSQDFAQAKKQRGLEADEAFVGGLILEIGLLMLHSACPPEIKAKFPAVALPLEELIAWEDEHLGINHREIGSLVLARWHFSEVLIESQKYFGPAALWPDRSVLSQVLEVARRAADIVFGRPDDLADLQRLAETHLHLDEETITRTLSEVFAKVEELGRDLNIQINSQTDILRVMEKANQALSRINTSMETSLQGLLDQVSRFDQSISQISTDAAHERWTILENTLDAVAHEIRNPLLAIGGLAKRLANQSAAGDRGGQYAKIIAEESTRLEQVLREITDYSQYYRPAFVQSDVVALMRQVLSEFAPAFQNRKIKVFSDFPDVSFRVLADAEGITKVFRQLLKNVLVVSRPTEGRLNISIKSRPANNQVVIVISDNGRPIPPEVREAWLGPNLTTKTFSGGLGLPLARKIVEAHHGRIELVAEEGRGNVVTIHLPLVQPS